MGAETARRAGFGFRKQKATHIEGMGGGGTKAETARTCPHETISVCFQVIVQISKLCHTTAVSVA